MTTYTPDRVAAAARGRWGPPAYPARIDKSGGPEACWPWTGTLRSYGYGEAKVDGVAHPAHRLALEESLGRQLAKGMRALHRCDNPPCCNPAHLFEGSQADNMRDMVAKRRHVAAVKPERVVRGERINTATLTEAQVRDIRQRYRPGESSPTNSVRLAAEFGVGHGTIWRAATGRTWTHLK